MYHPPPLLLFLSLPTSPAYASCQAIGYSAFYSTNHLKASSHSVQMPHNTVLWSKHTIFTLTNRTLRLQYPHCKHSKTFCLQDSYSRRWKTFRLQDSYSRRWKVLPNCRLFVLCVCLFVFSDKVSLQSPGCPGIHYRDKVVLELTEINLLQPLKC